MYNKINIFFPASMLLEKEKADADEREQTRKLISNSYGLKFQPKTKYFHSSHGLIVTSHFYYDLLPNECRLDMAMVTLNTPSCDRH